MYYVRIVCIECSAMKIILLVNIKNITALNSNISNPNEVYKPILMMK